jgi:hypothetical protein|tara:strand:+ start:644 stop:1237 length:594 start_codon:yes stop_codon:yes gene_type:complete
MSRLDTVHDLVVKNYLGESRINLKAITITLNKEFQQHYDLNMCETLATQLADSELETVVKSVMENEVENNELTKYIWAVYLRTDIDFYAIHPAFELPKTLTLNALRNIAASDVLETYPNLAKYTWDKTHAWIKGCDLTALEKRASELTLKDACLMVRHHYNLCDYNNERENWENDNQAMWPLIEYMQQFTEHVVSKN